MNSISAAKKRLSSRKITSTGTFKGRSTFFAPLVSWFGGSLSGKTVLDLGCNAGFWSLCATNAGADYVMGIDGRQEHIDQANFVFHVEEISESKYKFVCANIFDFNTWGMGTFDIVLCLGLFYHINRHVELLAHISRLSPTLLIIDTSLAPMSGSVLQLIHEDTEEPRNSTDYSLAYVPTSQAVFDLVGLFNYRVIMLKPNFSDYHGAEDYQHGLRRAFVCSRTAKLDGFPIAAETPSALDRSLNIGRGSRMAGILKSVLKNAKTRTEVARVNHCPRRDCNDINSIRRSRKKSIEPI